MNSIGHLQTTSMTFSSKKFTPFICLLVMFSSLNAQVDTCKGELNITMVKFSKMVICYQKCRMDSTYNSFSNCDKVKLTLMLNTITRHKNEEKFKPYIPFAKFIVKHWFTKIINDLEFSLEVGSYYRRYYSAKYDLYYGKSESDKSEYHIM